MTEEAPQAPAPSPTPPANPDFVWMTVTAVPNWRTPPSPSFPGFPFLLGVDRSWIVLGGGRQPHQRVVALRREEPHEVILIGRRPPVFPRMRIRSESGHAEIHLLGERSTIADTLTWFGWEFHRMWS